MTKILIVDDDSLLVRMYQKKFENDDYSVLTASDGVAALEILKTTSPDLILLDIMMPKMNGLEVLAKIKSNEGTSKIPVILLTNLGSSDEDAERGLELGAVAYLVKANNLPKDVVSKVKEILAGYTKEVPQVKSVIKE